MDRTRVAAWVAGIATGLLALDAAYSVRMTGDPGRIATALPGLLVPVGITLALVWPVRPLARATLPVSYCILLLGVGSALARAPDDLRPMLFSVTAWQFWLAPIQWLTVATISTAWAIRPSQGAAMATRIIASASAILTAYFSGFYPALDPQVTPARVVLWAFHLAPLVALAVGLPDVRQDGDAAN